MRIVSKIVPENEIELFGIVGGLQLKTLVEARKNYHREIDCFGFLAVKKQVVSFVYNKFIKKGFDLKKCGDDNVVSFI